MSLETSSLPDELISEILQYTDCKTLLSCRTSCRRLKNIVDKSTALQYMIELFGAGMCDGQSGGVGSAERLDRLRRSQTAWKSPTWREPVDFPYSKKIYPAPVAMSGNLMVFDDIAPSLSPGQDLLLLRFPSELRGIPEQQWSLHLDCDYIHAVCVDDSQDLLCFLSLPDVHVRSLSTGEIHPLTNAVGPIFSFGSEVPAGSFNLQIHEDLLMLVIDFLEHYILVFNWRTGGHVAKIPSFEFTQCAFLDRSNIIFSCGIRDNGEHKLRLRAVTLPNAADDASLHSYDFELPTLNDRSFPGGYILCANTLPSNNSTSYVPGLFHADPRGRLLALEIQTALEGTCADGLRQYFNLYILRIPHDTILSYIEAHTSNAETVVVPWQAWGPGNTRLIELPNGMLNYYSRSKLVCGMHALTRESELSRGGSLRIMDYHPRRVARILATEDMYLPGEVYIRGEGPESSNTTTMQQSGTHTSQDKQLPYVLKDILLPNGLPTDIRYRLGEDVVVLFEHAVDNPTEMWTDSRITRVLYHHI
ncbi:hypothetical protein BC826DRAFT_1183925 [Russula brevipes]|nr:hypothetical protein BC826DRAFT_1183925 [Russula brevipes]